VGVLITAVTILHWIGKHPMSIFNANQQGLGKTALAHLLGFILDGSCVSISYSPNDEEFEKQLATCVETGDRVVVIDNAKRGKVRDIDSPVLERSITAQLLNYRRLGSNTAIRRPNDVLFCLTMNDAKLSVDLRRRQVPINLEYFGTVRDRTFSIADLEEFVLAHRLDLRAEIVGIVQRWVADGFNISEAPARHSICQPWSATTDAILRSSGYVGFLKNFEDAERAFDTEYEALSEVCDACHAEAATTPAGWAARLMAAGLLSEKLLDQ